MKKTRKIIAIVLAVVAACAACFLAYRFTLMTVHGKSYEKLREKVLTVTPFEQPVQTSPVNPSEEPPLTQPNPQFPKTNPEQSEAPSGTSVQEASPVNPSQSPASDPLPASPDEPGQTKEPAPQGTSEGTPGSPSAPPIMPTEGETVQPTALVSQSAGTEVSEGWAQPVQEAPAAQPAQEGSQPAAPTEPAVPTGNSGWESTGETTDGGWNNSSENTAWENSWDSSWTASENTAWENSWENSQGSGSGSDTWDYNVDGYWDNTLDPNWQNTWNQAQSDWSQATVTTVDFAWLQSVNPDIYAWIEIPGTEISFPVLQDSSDINRYLRRFYDGSYSIVGSIFSAPGSAKDFSDYNTVLYGHNFGNSYMFGDLRDYSDESFMRSCQTILIYTPSATLTYTIFAAVSYSDVLLSSAFQFDTHYGREAFLRSLSDVRDWNSHVLDDVAVSADDNILVLSTCTNDGEERYLVTAVLRGISR